MSTTVRYKLFGIITTLLLISSFFNVPSVQAASSSQNIRRDIEIHSPAEGREYVKAKLAASPLASASALTGNILGNGLLWAALGPVFAGFKATFCFLEGLFLTLIGTLVWGASEVVIGILNAGNNIGNSSVLPSLVNAWKKVRDIGISLMTLVLIIIALANIFNVGGENFKLGRMIPKIILSIVMAYLSIVIIRFLLEFFSALQSGILKNMGGPNAIKTIFVSKYLNGGVTGFVTNFIKCATDNPISQIFKVIIYAILFIATLVIALYLIILAYFREVMLWFLLIIAPLAFMMNILPFTESLYKQWWSTFWKYAIMGPAIAFGLWFAMTMIVAYSKLTSSGPDIGFLMIIIASLFIAAAFPTMLGGRLMSQVGGRLQGVGRMVASPVTDTWNDYKNRRRGYSQDMARRRATNMLERANMLGKSPDGKGAPGVRNTLLRGVGRMASGSGPLIETGDETRRTEAQNRQNFRARQAAKEDLKFAGSDELGQIIKNATDELGRLINQDDQRALAALEMIASSEHTSQWDEQTTRALAQAYSDSGVSGAVIGNANKDASSFLLSKVGVALDPKSQAAIEAVALAQIGGKRRLEYTEDNIKALEKVMERPDYADEKGETDKAAGQKEKAKRIADSFDVYLGSVRMGGPESQIYTNNVSDTNRATHEDFYKKRHPDTT